MSTTSDSPLFAFVHIEKAAGTTLIHVLRRNFFCGYVDVRPLNSSSKGFFLSDDLKKYLYINPFLKCLGGHSVSPAHLAYDEKKILFFTVLRDPVRRYVSQFRYLVAINRLPNDFEKFLKDSSYHDFQTKKIAGTADVEKAKMLLGHMLEVGIVEDFDDFLIRLKHSLSPYLDFDPSFNIKNTNTKISNDQQIISQYKDVICENNAQDQELYRHVRDCLIPERKKHLGPEFEQKVKTNNVTSKNYYLKPAMDYSLRKFYYAPVSGFIRACSGLSVKGSY